MPARSVAVNPFATRVVSRYALVEAVAVLVSIANSMIVPLGPLLLVVGWVLGQQAAFTLLAGWLASSLLLLPPALASDLLSWLVGARPPTLEEHQRLAPPFDRVCRRAAVDPTLFDLRVIEPPDWYEGVWINGAAAGLSVVAVSHDALRLLDEPELEGLLAHELGHLLGMDALPRAVAAWHAAFVEALLRPLGWRAVSVCLSVVFLPLLIVGAFVSRPAEYNADRFALRLGRAQGLQRLLARFGDTEAPSFAAALLATHPANADRRRRLDTVH